MIDLTQLRAFAVIAREGNLTRAAERLHLTQSAVSLQIKNLQERLKVSLFSRPADRLTISESIVSPAMRSAASTASRIACSALSMSMTTPDFTPSER